MFFVLYSRLCCHCGNLTKGSCLLSPFHFKLFCYFLSHVACQNLTWQLGLIGGTILTCLEYPSKRDLVFNEGCSHCKHIKSSYATFLSRCTIFHPNKQLLTFEPNSSPDLSQSQLLFHFLELFCFKFIILSHQENRTMVSSWNASWKHF